MIRCTALPLIGKSDLNLTTPSPQERAVLQGYEAYVAYQEMGADPQASVRPLRNTQSSIPIT